MLVDVGPDPRAVDRCLRRLDVPTLVVHGMRDPLISPSGGMATARAVPGARLLLFPDMGHDLPVPRRTEIAGRIVAASRDDPRYVVRSEKSGKETIRRAEALRPADG